MTKKKPTRQVAETKQFRCAIYTRKSTEEGLEQEFNTLDAQRESAEAYIKSQAALGWICSAEHYDDGGFTGGNMDRPAVKRLMADIEAGKVNCVVVYKVDRLSRSLLDFARMMETFDKHNVSFVSVTQQFNTASSMGRLVLNVLLSFAQFEREIISERTRDKIAAARRKGKWSGGMPILGYDVSMPGSKLIVNEEEAVQVRAIFNLYADNEALMPVVQELDRRGWLNKRWTTRKGHERGGLPFTKTSVYKLLTNATYVGKVRYKTETHNGEHQGIVPPELWQKVQSVLARNGRTGGAIVRNKFGAILKGVLHCGACNCAMTPTHVTRNQTKRYRYYVCVNAQKRGWHSCPTKQIPAGEIERFVVDQIRGIGRDPALIAETVQQVTERANQQLAELKAEEKRLGRELAGYHRDLQRRAKDGLSEQTVCGLADLHERIRANEQRLTEVRQQLNQLQADALGETNVAAALARFDDVWAVLGPHEQSQLVRLLVERIVYDGRDGSVAITFHNSGIQTLLSDAMQGDAA
jgi:site-specific DNA recombinase